MVTHPRSDVLIIGAGVSGLSTAVCLAEAGFSVQVLAELPPEWTTSARAGASWGPYLMTHPKALDWCHESFQTLTGLAEVPRSGIHMGSGIEAAFTQVEPPGWAREVPTFQMCRKDELPTGYAVGWRYTLPLADMARYLTYLSERLLAADGVFAAPRQLSTLSDVSGAAGVVVNCSGLGARELALDKEIVPVRGQLLVVKNPGVDWFFQEVEEESDGEADELTEVTYFLPHGAVVVLGGCLHRDSEGLEPDEGIRDRIRARCAAVEPLLAEAEFLADRVGLRPMRPQVRVEAEEVDGQRVVHNYGHGGAGLTLSWGCANEVRRLITEMSYL
jgi:D-amino-acid oxidase